MSHSFKLSLVLFCSLIAAGSANAKDVSEAQGATLTTRQIAVEPAVNAKVAGASESAPKASEEAPAQTDEVTEAPKEIDANSPHAPSRVVVIRYASGYGYGYQRYHPADDYDDGYEYRSNYSYGQSYGHGGGDYCDD